MPVVTIRYNDSPDCVLIHHGVRPHGRKDRIDLMRPLADEVVATLAARHPGLTFQAKRAELRGPVLLLWVDHPDGLPQWQVDDILSVTNGINTDFTRLIDPYPSVVEALPTEDREVLRRLGRVGLRDSVSVMRVIDACLAVVDGAATLAAVDVLVRIYAYTCPETYGELSTGYVDPFGSFDGETLIGFRFAIGTPATVGLIAHETAHVLESMFGHWRTDKHDDTFVSHFSRVLRMMVSTGCEERVRALAGPGEVVAPTWCEQCPDLLEDARWRMSTGEGDTYALWCRDDVSQWGVGSSDNERFLSHLDDEERAFVMQSIGPPQVGDCDLTGE